MSENKKPELTEAKAKVNVEPLVSGRELFDYREHFNKWNNREDANFNDFVLWCIHTKQGKEFIKKALLTNN